MFWRRSDTVYALVVAAIVATAAWELRGVWVTNSLGLYSDALHLCADLIPILLGWWALRKASRALGRLTTLLNIFLLAGVGILIFREALERYLEPQDVSPAMLKFAFFAMVGNGAQLFFGRTLHDEHGHDHTGFSQVLHLMMDFAASVAVLIGAAALYMTGLSWPDLAAAGAVMALSFCGSIVAGIKYFAPHPHHHPL